MTETNTLARANAAQSVPLLRFIGAELVNANDPRAGLSLITGGQGINAAGYLHGGVISTVLDLAAWLALLPLLSSDEEAVTHNILVSYIVAVRGRVQLMATAKVLRRGRRLAFVAAELRDAERLVASAQVTKSIVEVR